MLSIMRHRHFHQIPIHEPYLNGNELEYIPVHNDWLGFLTRKYVKKFEKIFKICRNRQLWLLVMEPLHYISLLKLSVLEKVMK